MILIANESTIDAIFYGIQLRSNGTFEYEELIFHDSSAQSIALLTL